MKKFRNCSTIELLVTDAIQDYYDPDLVKEICDRAGLADAYAESHGETFESVYYRALEILEDKEGL